MSPPGPPSPGHAPPPTAPGADDFEFAALAEARNYRRALLRRFAPHLRGRVLEIGAGIGQFTSELRTLPGLTELVSLEPETRFHAAFRASHPGQTLIAGTAADAPSGPWHAIVSVNVLEHIGDDGAELVRYRELLAPTGGCLCLFVPARTELYAAIDRDFGHFRRYHRPGLNSSLRQAGFTPEHLHYLNFAGYLGWWFNFRLLGKRQFDPAAVRWFDRLIFPPTHWLETHLLPPPVGQSLLAIARPTGSLRRS